MKYKLLKFIAAAFVAGLIIGLSLRIHNQNKAIDALTNDLQETQEQLLISKDQLRQIEARNEAIKYIEELEE